MGKSFFVDTNDADLYAASQLFATKITLTPLVFGLVAADATAYNALDATWGAAYLAAKNPETRTKSAIIARQQARKNLVVKASELARRISGTSTVTDEQLNDLGLSVRAAGTRKPAPDFMPNIRILSREGTNVEIKLHDGTTRRGRPANVKGASIFSHVGPTPPAELNTWVFQGNSYKTKLTVGFDTTLAPGTVVWITAFWFNAAGAGPGCSPVSAILAGGGMSMAA